MSLYIDKLKLIEWLGSYANRMHNTNDRYDKGKRFGFLRVIDEIKSGEFDSTTIHKEVERYREALKFYASYWNNEVQREGEGLTSIQKDMGKIARDALSIKIDEHTQGENP